MMARFDFLAKPQPPPPVILNRMTLLPQYYPVAITGVQRQTEFIQLGEIERMLESQMLDSESVVATALCETGPQQKAAILNHSTAQNAGTIC